MIIVKFLILVLVFVCSFFIGLLIAKKYANRVKELKEMKNALTMCKTKMKFTYASIPEIFEEISTKIDGEVGMIFKLSANKMKDQSAGEAWNESIDLVYSSMKEEDKTVLKNLGKMLGKTDLEGQISEIELVNHFLDTQIEMAESEKRKNEKMYKTLGGIIGLTLVIILI